MPLSPPNASMGFVGYVRFRLPDGTTQVRARSADIRLSQEIQKPDVIDSRFDRSVYQLGPMIVGGTVEYPAIMGDIGAGNDPTAALYKLAAKRNWPGDGKLTAADVAVAYTNRDASFIYKDCIINQFNFSVAQQDVISVSLDVIGLERDQDSYQSMTEESPYFPEQARIVTWNDAIVELNNPGVFEIGGEYVRSFDASLANNAERYYTLNGKLSPQDIAPRKRDLTGSVSLMGRLPRLGDHAYTNQARCSEGSSVRFGYKLTNANCSGTFVVTLPNVVFEIEEMNLTNDIFETSINWHALPNALDLTSSEYLETS